MLKQDRIIQSPASENLASFVATATYQNTKMQLERQQEIKKLTAQFGSNASIVGERPRYIPLKPSVLTIFCKLVMITLPRRKAKVMLENQSLNKCTSIIYSYLKNTANMYHRHLELNLHNLSSIINKNFSFKLMTQT